MEFIITGLLLIVALSILYKNIKAKKNGTCTSCSSKGCSGCPYSSNCNHSTSDEIEKK